MLLHGWMLTPLLCYSFLSALHAASLPSVAPHQTWSSDTETQSGNRAEPSDWPRTRSFWPYWHPTGGTTETKTSSFLLLPFKLALNLWSPSPQSEAHVSEPDHFTPVSPINHSIQGSRDSNTQPAASWGKPYSSGCAGTSLRPEPAPTAAPSDARPPDGLSSRDTGLESALPESQRPAVALATESTTSNDRLPRTERVATWGSSHPRREPSTRAALLTPVVASTFPVPQRARTRPGVQPETDMGFLDGVLHKQTGMETTTKANEDVHEDEFEKHPHQRAASTASPSGKLPVEDFLSDPSVEGPSSTPDHPVDPAGTGGPATRGPVSTQSNGTSNETSDDLLPLPPSMFVPLYSDWNSAMATWGAAWEAHVYGLGAVFALVALLSVLNLLCLPVRCPSGCGYFVLVNLFLLAAGASRGFLLFYDAYSHQDKLPGAATLLLYEAPFPCLTAAFGTVFLLISTRSRIQLPRAVIHHPCFLAASVLLHFGAAFGSVAVLHVFPRLPCLFLVSQGTSVVLAAILATVYFVFYCYVQADSKHIYHLDHASPPAKRHGRCPFADARDWERAAVTVAFGALFTLACAGLRLYAMLHALGLVGVEVFHPWPWWAFHLSCQLCEVGLCLALALVIMHPVCSSSKPPGAKYRPRTSRGLSNPTATKPPVLPSNHPWATSQQGELAPGDTVSRSECERLPLYPMASHHLGSVDGLDLLCTSEPALDLPDRNPSLTLRLGTEADSTADLRPPSPINLRRSIDEALFSEALIPRSLFSLPRPRSPSGISLGAWSVSDGRPFRRNLAGRPLCRTSSCTDSDVALPGQPRPLTGSSPSSCHTLEDTSSAVGRWHSSPPAPLRGPTTDTFSAGLCSNQDQGSSPQRKGSISPEHTSQGGVSQPTPFGRGYQALELPPHPEDDNLSVQAEFINVCRQIDALSICSDTIEL